MSFYSLTQDQKSRVSLLPGWLKFIAYLSSLALLLFIALPFLNVGQVSYSYAGIYYNGPFFDIIAIPFHIFTLMVGVSGVALLRGVRWAIVLSIIVWGLLSIASIFTTVVVDNYFEFSFIMTIPLCIKFIKIQKEWR